MPRDSDLSSLLRLLAHLRARPDGPYMDSKGAPCRHPAGIYAQSLSQVLHDMRKLTDTIQVEAHPDVLRTVWPDAMAALKALLVTVDSHADDLKTILALAAAPPLDDPRKVRDRIDGVFEELAGRPVNRVKHNAERFEACYCFNDELAVYGYFVAGPRADGAIAPSERAHGKTGMQWSFAVTLRRLLGQLVQAAGIVHPHVRSALVLPPAKWSEQERADLAKIAAWLQQSSPYCFPNEAHLRVPYFTIKDGEPHLRIQTLNRLRDAHSRPGVRWSRTFSMDGATRSFAVG
jgi:hypothetical protein